MYIIYYVIKCRCCLWPSQRVGVHSLLRRIKQHWAARRSINRPNWSTSAGRGVEPG